MGMSGGGSLGIKIDEAETARMTYQCGDCGSIDTYKLSNTAATRCPNCGGRVLYKLRTKRCVLAPRARLSAAGLL